MVTLQVRKGLKKKQVAALLDVSVRTVRRVTKLEAATGSVVREPISKGPRRLLNGIDCAVSNV
jgi:transposase